MKKIMQEKREQKTSIRIQPFQREKEDSSSSSNEIMLHERSDVSEALQTLMQDTFDEDSRMSGIDMRTILHHNEISGILAIDMLVSFGFLPSECSKFTRLKKRLNVSLKGVGRQQIVDIISGDREQKKETGLKGFMNRFTGMSGFQK